MPLINECAVLHYLKVEADLWLVLLRAAHENDRYIVGVVASSGDVLDDARHATLESARLDFDTRCMLQGWADDAGEGQVSRVT